MLPRHRPVGGHVKRAIDVALALTALMVLAPLFVLVAILLRVGLGRSILVAERHLGFAGKVFTTYTFRTLPVGGAGDRAIAACLTALRASQIDRLPKLFSILRGDMSFVGPRPVTLDAFDRRRYFGQDYLLANLGWSDCACPIGGARLMMLGAPPRLTDTTSAAGQCGSTLRY